MLAFGAMVEARARGLNVPADISIIGFDDLDFAAHLEPPLSTVEVPSVELGRATAAHIVALCSDAPVPQHGALPTRLVLRGTTAPPESALKCVIRA
jgi:LacI family transcriptional regulator